MNHTHKHFVRLYEQFLLPLLASFLSPHPYFPRLPFKSTPSRNAVLLCTFRLYAWLPCYSLIFSTFSLCVLAKQVSLSVSSIAVLPPPSPSQFVLYHDISRPRSLTVTMIARFIGSIPFTFMYFTLSGSHIPCSSAISCYRAPHISNRFCCLCSFLSSVTTNCPMRRLHFRHYYSWKNANKLVSRTRFRTHYTKAAAEATFFPPAVRGKNVEHTQYKLHFIENICFYMTLVSLFRVFFLFFRNFTGMPCCFIVTFSHGASFDIELLYNGYEFNLRDG